ncbi:hypothetical protein EMCRGX_G014031 [Ephydatia muelleri]
MSSSEEDEVKENLVEEAYQYLRRKSYPAGASEGRKRCIRRKAAKFVLKNGELFFKKMNKGKESEIRYVVNTEEQQRILHGCHNDPTAGHMGVKRTLIRINERFRWPGMVKDMTNMVARGPGWVVSLTGARSGSAAGKAEVRKHNANDAKCTELGWVFIPLVVETYGCWGVEAQGSISRLAARLALQLQCSKSKAITSIYQRLNLTLVHCNARALLPVLGFSIQLCLRE